MTRRPDFRRALVGLPISLVVLGVLSLFVREKKPEPSKKPPHQIGRQADK